MSSQKYPYFAPFEVVIHNNPDDCWVSILGKVLDITPLIAGNKSKKCVGPLLAVAGKDISHWFDERTGDIRYCIHHVTGCRVPYCPNGLIPDVQPVVPSTDWRPLDRLPWWRDEKYQIGVLTKRVRPIRIINMICPFFKEVPINVCREDSFYRIQERYLLFNRDASSYTWRYCGKNLDMNKTMEENGIIDERDRFTELGLPQDYYIPSVFLYYDDDLKYEDVDDEDEYLPMPTKCVERSPGNKM